MLTLIWLNLTQIRRNKGELVSMLLLPVLLTVVFGLAMGGGGGDRPVRFAFVPRDDSYQARQAWDLLAHDEASEVKLKNSADAQRLLAEGKVDAVVTVPKGFGSALEEGRLGRIEVRRQPSAEGLAAARLVEGVAERIAANMIAAREASAAVDHARADVKKLWERTHPVLEPGIRLAPRLPQHLRALFAREEYFQPAPLVQLYGWADSYWSPEPPVGVKAETVTASEVRGDSTQAEGVSQYSLGFTVMFMLFIAMGSAGGILEERENGTLQRMLVTPASRVELVGGKILGVLATSLVEAAILIGVGALVFKVPWGDDPPALLMIVGSYALAATGLGVLVSAVARTRGQLAAISNVLVVSLAMLGGCYWPIDIVAPTMRAIAVATPTGWAMAGLTDVVVRHQGVAAAVTPSLVLLGFAAAFFVVGLKMTRFE